MDRYSFGGLWDCDLYMARYVCSLCFWVYVVDIYGSVCLSLVFGFEFGQEPVILLSFFFICDLDLTFVIVSWAWTVMFVVSIGFRDIGLDKDRHHCVCLRHCDLNKNGAFCLIFWILIWTRTVVFVVYFKYFSTTNINSHF